MDSVEKSVKWSHYFQMDDKRPMPYPLRMPSDLREKLEAARSKSGRSLNAEIILRLERSLSEEPIQEAARDALKEQIKREIQDELAELIREVIRNDSG